MQPSLQQIYSVLGHTYLSTVSLLEPTIELGSLKVLLGSGIDRLLQGDVGLSRLDRHNVGLDIVQGSIDVGIG